MAVLEGYRPVLQRMIKMKKSLLHIIASVTVIFLAGLFLPSSASSTRIKEIANFEGIRSNHLVGYGLVVGLERKGDKSGTEFTTQSLVNMLNRFGIKVDQDNVITKNVAAVIVTAELSPFDRLGARLDVTVSSIGDAKTLQGGTLIFTPLIGADGEVYAVAQGSVSIGGFVGGDNADTVQKNFQTVGRVPGGALVEMEIPLTFYNQVNIVLNVPDFTTSSRIAAAINAVNGPVMAEALDATKVRLDLSKSNNMSKVSLLSAIELINVSVDTTSKVVVNERTGTIVIGENVSISNVAVAQGNLTVQVETTNIVSQPAPFSRRGETVVVPEKTVTVTEEGGSLVMIDKVVRLKELVRALNALGVTPRDLIAILQSIKAAGALQAELVII